MATMVWKWLMFFKPHTQTADDLTPIWQSIQHRLKQLAEAQLELKKQTCEIASIATNIIETLRVPDETSDAIKELVPLIKEIPPLLNEAIPILRVIPPALKSVDDQIVAITDRQEQLHQDLHQLRAVVSTMSTRLDKTLI
jgi:hypothetical protein